MDEHEDQEPELQVWEVYEANLQNKPFIDALEEAVLMTGDYSENITGR